jgi:branched-chain amino acid transport system substrate-binding protein
MRAAPVNYLGRPAALRQDGRLLYDLIVYRVKTPEQSRAPWDYYTKIGAIPAEQAFLPITPECAA